MTPKNNIEMTIDHYYSLQLFIWQFHDFIHTKNYSIIKKNIYLL